MLEALLLKAKDLLVAIYHLLMRIVTWWRRGGCSSCCGRCRLSASNCVCSVAPARRVSPRGIAGVSNRQRAASPAVVSLVTPDGVSSSCRAHRVWTRNTQYGRTNRIYLCLWNYDRQRRNSNGKAKVFDDDEFKGTVPKWLRQRPTTGNSTMAARLYLGGYIATSCCRSSQ